MMCAKEPLVILTGPTCVGKTSLSTGLAKRIDGEIISADSMQVYRYMDIGSAKIKREEMEGVTHHLIDILMPNENFHVQKFQSLAKEAIKEIRKRGHIPILTGGTGFYIQSVLYDVAFTKEEGDGKYRKELEALTKERGAEYVHGLLAQADPLSAGKIHPNNTKRVIRALEYYKLTGEPISGHNERERKKEAAYNACYFVLNDVRERLYARIEKRVDEMMDQGLVEEVRRLKDMGCSREMVSMQGLGYKEIFSFLLGEISLDRAVFFIKQNTRHFAKRQLTWFRREREVIWVEKEDFDYNSQQILDFMTEKIREKGISVKDER